MEEAIHSSMQEVDRSPVFKAPGYQLVRFTARCNAEQVSLLIGADGGRPDAFHRMSERTAGCWQLTLHLRPGTYRYRYYVTDSRRVVYAPPNEMEDQPICMEGFDAVLKVPARSASENDVLAVEDDSARGQALSPVN